MPEGPSLVLLREAIQSFIGNRIVDAQVNSPKLSRADIIGRKIMDIRTWGKHLLIDLPDFTIRIHLMMFGSYRINDTKENAVPKLALYFTKDRSITFYACAIKRIDGSPDELYDWEADVLSPRWNVRKAMKKLRLDPDVPICDALLDQQVFAGVGNIIKNEVLFRVRVHPLSRTGSLPDRKKRQIVHEAALYSAQFLEWKRAGQLKKNWLVYTKKKCPRDGHPIVKKYLGNTRRRTFYCETCQQLYR